MEGKADDSFVEDSADVDARKMAMKAAEGTSFIYLFIYSTN